ncbi:tRNA lysidine(34) synthetase TilS [Paucibacter sp. AS339]|uniref:tRNA lysidine(34) synthetase TilS n=1 Tax=Paucibacter hankyongi TaxID=3133434 RepID=UPI0030AC273A
MSRCVAVAYSGGRDSTALLHAVAHQAQRLNQEQGAGLEVLALHVHHGLSPQADAWLWHCQNQCDAWAESGLPLRLQTCRLSTAPAAAQSVEAWAREQRYAALSRMAREGSASLILLAHHRRDQAETLLLQALRGAGVAGLAGMPMQQWRDDGLCWARPWLDLPRESVQAYVRQHALTHIEDDSNTDTRFARNRLRLDVWPALLAAFPQAELSLARSATWAQQALALQDEVAAEDLQRLSDGQSGLAVQGLLGLSAVRARNALRAWLAEQTGRPAPSSLVLRLERELGQGDVATWPYADGVLRLYRGRLSWQRKAPEAAAESAKAMKSVSIDLSAPGRYPQAEWGGAWLLEETMGTGVDPKRLRAVLMRSRSGGEQFQRAPNSCPRSLKKAYQEAGVPSWLRQGPLLFVDAELLYVPGLGLDARQLTAPGEPAYKLSWVPDSKQFS